MSVTCKYSDKCSYEYCPINDGFYIEYGIKPIEEEVQQCAGYIFERATSHVQAWKRYMTRSVMSFFCRSVGPGGTSLNFHVTEEGLKGLWVNENCPYESKGFTTKEGKVYPDVFAYKEYDGEHFPDEASDGHNVSKVSWETLAELVDLAKENGWV